MTIDAVVSRALTGSFLVANKGVLDLHAGIGVLGGLLDGIQRRHKVRQPVAAKAARV
ncbi:MAG: hypothetical protein M3069_02460 [Chloroflexota bacterium]|nr:hypothetical protein [Chloroflexota bacterium]